MSESFSASTGEKVAKPDKVFPGQWEERQGEVSKSV